ncbi:Hemocytin, partial [Stegodyphus mimosarum]
NAKYEEPLPGSEVCCGSCKPFACEENGILYENGATWDSTTDPCFTANCIVNENGTLIRYSKEGCPVMPDNCPTENVVTDPKGCCTYCKMTRETCSAVQVPLYETRGFFEYLDKKRGLCTNGKSLSDLTKCSGTCTAESRFSKLTGDFQSICNCCLPQKTKDRTIILTCEDGSQVQKTYHQPITCQCSTCSGKDLDLEALDNIQPY